MALRPVEFHLRDGLSLAGVEEAEPAPHFTMIFLHEAGGDLDALLPVVGLLGFAEARKVAIDLPGHGLSTGEADEASLREALPGLLQEMRRRGWGPFLLVAAGSTAMPTLRLAAAANDMLGICLVSPRLDTDPAGETLPRCPLLAFVASKDEAATAEWVKLRGALQSWWLGVTVGVTHAALVTSDAEVSAQVASHLQGFARDIYVASPLLAGRIA